MVYIKGKYAHMCISVSAEEHAQLKFLAGLREESVSALIRSMLKTYLDHKPSYRSAVRGLKHFKSLKEPLDPVPIVASDVGSP